MFRDERLEFTLTILRNPAMYLPRARDNPRQLQAFKLLHQIHRRHPSHNRRLPFLPSLPPGR